MLWPASAGCCGSGAGVCSRNSPRARAWCSSSSDRRNLANSGLISSRDASRLARSASGISSALSRYGLTSRHCSGLRVVICPSDGNLATKLAVQIDAGFLPAPLNGALGHGAHGGDFDEGETAKEFQVHDLGERSVDLSKFFEHLIDAGEFAVVDGAAHGLGVERSKFKFAAALLCVPVSHMIDDQPAHHTGSITHEARTIRK